MKIAESYKFWFILIGILFAAFFGGILGNWVFIYLLDKYYGIPGGNYLAAPTSSSVIVRDAKKVIVEQDNRIAATVASADRGMVRIFKRNANGIYQIKDAVATAAVMTSDGWIVTPSRLTPAANNSFDAYEAVSADRRRFSIEKIEIDSVSGLSFIRLARAQNLSVSGFISSAQLSVGQTLISIAPDSSIEVGRLSRQTPVVRASEGQPTTLLVSDFTPRGAYFFDAAGQMAGLSDGKTIFAMDSIQSVLENLLTEGKIERSRLGVHFLNLSQALASGNETGILLTALDAEHGAVIPNSPADRAGLRAGDIITAIDETALNEFSSFPSLLQEYRPGEQIILSVKRGTETLNVSITLDAYEASVNQKQ
jgi:S1-C subfamily serine protease